MNHSRPLAIAILLPLAACASAPASAQSIPVTAFEAVELRGGGEVVVRRGDRHRVTLLRGDLRTSRIEVEREATGDPRLVIEACRSSCRNYRLRVEIVTPRLDAIAIRGGGEIDVEPGFPAPPSLALAVTGGGSLDARALRAGSVAAAVRGGGTILTHPARSLAAAVRGGGSIVYSGDPQVVQSVRGGGAVTRARSR